MGDAAAPPAAPVEISGYNKPPRAVRWPKFIPGTLPQHNSRRNEEVMVMNQPKGGLLSPNGFPLAVPGDGASGFWSMVFPPGESPQCRRRITHLPFTRGYLGFLPLSTEQLVGSNPKAI